MPVLPSPSPPRVVLPPPIEEPKVTESSADVAAAVFTVVARGGAGSGVGMGAVLAMSGCDRRDGGAAGGVLLWLAQLWGRMAKNITDDASGVMWAQGVGNALTLFSLHGVHILIAVLLGHFRHGHNPTYSIHKYFVIDLAMAAWGLVGELVVAQSTFAAELASETSMVLAVTAALVPGGMFGGVILAVVYVNRAVRSGRVALVKLGDVGLAKTGRFGRKKFMEDDQIIEGNDSFSSKGLASPTESTLAQLTVVQRIGGSEVVTWEGMVNAPPNNKLCSSKRSMWWIDVEKQEEDRNDPEGGEGDGSADAGDTVYRRCIVWDSVVQPLRSVHWVVVSWLGVRQLIRLLEGFVFGIGALSCKTRLWVAVGGAMLEVIGWVAIRPFRSLILNAGAIIASTTFAFFLMAELFQIPSSIAQIAFVLSAVSSVVSAVINVAHLWYIRNYILPVIDEANDGGIEDENAAYELSEGNQSPTELNEMTETAGVHEERFDSYPTMDESFWQDDATQQH